MSELTAERIEPTSRTRTTGKFVFIGEEIWMDRLDGAGWDAGGLGFAPRAW